MKILFVSALLPYPLHSGGQVRVYNLLKILSRKHEITLLAFIRDQEEQKLVKNLAFCHRVETVFRGHAWQPGYVLSSILGKYPFLFSTYNNYEMRRRINEELVQEKPDLIHLEPGYVWPSLPKSPIPTVVAEHNIESTIYEGYVRRYPLVPLRSFLYLDVLKLKYWERQVWRSARAILTVSELDAAVVKSQTKNAAVFVVPNGVDPAIFPFKPKVKISPPLTFLFIGNFSWLQNRDALRFLLRDLWPVIRSRFPKVQLQIVGKQMPEDLRLLVRKNQAKTLEDLNDITSQYHQADIMLAPIRVGGGTKFKILEAMASGIPVITTTSGAKGLVIADRREVMIADNAETTIAAIKELLKTKVRQALVSAARKRIEELYTWEHIAETQAAVWQRIYDQKS